MKSILCVFAFAIVSTFAAHTINLGGGIAQLGGFYATLQLGTPAQTLNVQVDTGSSDLLVYGRLCHECDSNVTYGAIYSKSYDAVACDAQGYKCANCIPFLSHPEVCSFSDYYGDGSGVNGSVLTDLMNVADFENIKVSFGYILNSTSDFETNPMDGIWGISYPDLGITVPALYDLFKQTNVYEGFTMCLTNSYQGVSNKAASMSFGKPNNMNAFQFTPITQQQYYNVQLDDIQVNGQSLGVGSGPAIVDSGTTLLLFGSSNYQALFQSFQSLCQQGTNLPGVCDQSSSNTGLFGGQCTQISSADIANFPTINVVLDQINTPFAITPKMYLIPGCGANGYFFGIGNAGSAFSGAILGDTFMGGWNVFFDIQGNQIGFADLSSCP